MTTVSTYRVKPVRVSVTYPATVCHVLTCEQCEQPLGNASTPADLAGISADVILALWPEMDSSVKTHETYCPGNNRR